jgi:hypothetical protein
MSGLIEALGHRAGKRRVLHCGRRPDFCRPTSHCPSPVCTPARWCMRLGPRQSSGRDPKRPAQRTTRHAAATRSPLDGSPTADLEYCSRLVGDTGSRLCQTPKTCPSTSFVRALPVSTMFHRRCFLSGLFISKCHSRSAMKAGVDQLGVYRRHENTDRVEPHSVS